MRMALFQLLFCLAVFGSIPGSFGFDNFRTTNLADDLNYKALTDPKDITRQSVNALTANLEHGQRDDAVTATTEIGQDEIESIKEKQENLTTVVGNLVSSLNRVEKQAETAAKAREKSMKYLTTKNKHLESVVKDMKKTIEGLMESGVDAVKSSVSDLGQRVLKLETTHDIHDEMDLIKENHQALNTIVATLVSSSKKTDEGTKSAMKSLERSIKSLSSKYLHLESMMKVMNKTIPEVMSHNLALRKPTKASSVRNYWTAKSAVDGSLATSGWSGSCFSPDEDDIEPWWQVDLESAYVITEVKITARGDCCAHHLQDFTVEVFAEDPDTVMDTKPQQCYVFDDRYPKRGETIARKCAGPVNGRYVRITGKEMGKLTFCEVQVFGAQNPE